MKATSKLNIVALTLLAGLLSLESATAADLEVRSHHKRYSHVASLEQVSYVPSECSVGWWQTVVASHVRPRWAMRCR